MATKFKATNDFEVKGALQRIRALEGYGVDADYLPAHYALIEGTLNGLINGFDGAGSYENSQNVRILKLAAALIATLNGHERTLIEGLSEETIAALEAVLY